MFAHIYTKQLQTLGMLNEKALFLNVALNNTQQNVISAFNIIFEVGSSLQTGLVWPEPEQTTHPREVLP